VTVVCGSNRSELPGEPGNGDNREGGGWGGPWGVGGWWGGVGMGVRLVTSRGVIGGGGVVGGVGGGGCERALGDGG